MELNVASSSKPPPLVQPKFRNNQKGGKGSWKKRRRDFIIQRSKFKSATNKREKSKAQIIQAQEFESGVDDKDCKNKAESSEKELEEEKQNNSKTGGHASKRRKISTATSTTTQKNDGGDGGSSSLNFTRKRSKVTNKSKQTNITKPDQTPEAINATLEVIGAGLSSVPNTANSKEKSHSTKKRPRNIAKNSIKSKYNIEKDNDDDSDDDDSDDDDNSDDDQKSKEQSFDDIGLYRSVSYHMSTRLGMTQPTEVQQRVLKEALSLKNDQRTFDLLVRSPTGSGKTLAYLLPIAHYLLNRTKRISREDGALGIIVVPTHELADQVAEVAERLLRPWHWIVIGRVVGGENKRSEKARLRRGVNVLVATPGRLLDHMRNTQSFMYRFCEFLVLDEADRLLDLGFESEVKEIVQNLDYQAKISNPDAGRFRSNVLLSATLRKDVEKLAKFSLQEPTEIIVNTTTKLNNDKEDTTSSTAKFSMPVELRQHYCVVEQKHRLVTLACFLRLRSLKDVPRGNLAVAPETLPTCKVIVFFSTCDSVDFHYDLFNKTKLPDELRQPGTLRTSTDLMVPLKSFKLHGNHSQADRMAALKGFRNCNRAVLLCTDVAARGLDLKGLTFAIQYDPPTGGDGEELEYMHRAGRTARIGARGDALLFLLPSESKYVSRLRSSGVDITEISGSAALAALYPQANLTDSGGISYATRLVTSAVQTSLDQAIEKDETLKHEAVAGFQAYCRAYATHAREVRHYFHVRNLHLGHVARAFVLSDKPAEFAEMMAEIRRAKAEDNEEHGGKTSSMIKDKDIIESSSKGEIARAIAEGERQPFNQQNTELSRRRREKGRGVEAYKEMASEFAA